MKFSKKRVWQILKYFFGGCIAILTIAAIFLYSQIGPIRMNKYENKLVHNIKRHLRNPNDWALVSEIYNRPWETVCVDETKSLGNMISRDSLSKNFNVPIDQLHLPYGLRQASMRNSLVMFYEPPNSVYMLRIANGALHLHGGRPKNPDVLRWVCHARDDAVFAAGEPIVNGERSTVSFVLTYIDAMKERK